MKKLLCLLLLLLLPVLALAEEAESFIDADPLEPLYRARMYRDTRIRKVQDMDSRDWLGLVPEDAFVDVYEYGEEWCLCGYEGDVGYLPTERLYEMWQIGPEPLPGFVPMEGLAIMMEEAFLTVEDYEGNAVKPGDIIAVIDQQGNVPMMRSQTKLPEGSFRFEPFVRGSEARPGDAIYGFTTWFPLDEDDSLIVGRVYNIELAIERLNGTVIWPGEEFSYNDLCAPYSYDNGYKKAPNISRDGVGVSGGVCQVSTTIFQALQGMNVELTEWYVHSYAGVQYAKRNHDCAVATWKDFRFINHYDFPIEMTVMAQDGVLTCVFRKGGEE
ncbi:MAG: VanW family protein [Clostridia bacterium]|nr:VanW family protein [Clostridia bacterium]